MAAVGGDLRDLAREKHLELEVEAAPDVPEVLLGDAARLGQVLRSLGGNAIKFTRSGGVVIGVQCAGSPQPPEADHPDSRLELLFSVADTGIGIRPEDTGRIFESFTQADGSFTRRFGGAGLGLAIANRLVERMAALRGAFTDPATWGEAPAKAALPANAPNIRHLFLRPPSNGAAVTVRRGPNIAPLPPFAPLPERIEAPVALKVGDNITTDHILPAGPQITALRSNIPAISDYIFNRVDAAFVPRIKALGRGIILAGENYGQGSSREHDNIIWCMAKPATFRAGPATV